MEFKNSVSNFAEFSNEIKDMVKTLQELSKSPDVSLRIAVACSGFEPERFITDPHPGIRGTLIKWAIENQNLDILIKMKKDPDDNLRNWISKGSEKICKEYAESDPIFGVRTTAISRINDEEYLKKFIDNSTDERLKTIAKYRLEELEEGGEKAKYKFI